MARTIRKEIKRPDAFQTFGAQAMGWLESRAKPILIAGGAVLLAGAAAWGYRYWSDKMQERASLSYMVALTPQEEAKGPQVEEALRRTVLAYPRTRSGMIARLDLARMLRERGEFPGAEQEYRILIASSAAGPMGRELAQRGLAAVLEAQGKCAEAIALWRDILGGGSLLGQEDLYLSIAGCQEKAGSPQEAAKTLEEFSQKFPRSPFLNEIHRERMDRLAGPAAPAAKTPPVSPAKPTK